MKNNFLNTLLLLSILLIIGLACDPPKDDAKPATSKETTTTQKETKSATEPKEEVSKVTWKETDDIYNLKSKKTDAQKEELWKNYKGKKVQWEGTVTDIQDGLLSGYNLFIKMKKATLTHDLMIGLDDSQKEKVLKVSKGDKVKFKGTLGQWGSLLSISLDDGEIQ